MFYDVDIKPIPNYIWRVMVRIRVNLQQRSTCCVCQSLTVKFQHNVNLWLDKVHSWCLWHSWRRDTVASTGQEVQAEGANLSLQSRSSFCMSTSSFLKLPNADWSLDESFPPKVTSVLASRWPNSAFSFPSMLPPYVPLYLMNSISEISAGTFKFTSEFNAAIPFCN